MKQIIRAILAVILMMTIVSGAYAAGYTLPEKMERQIQIGSGLKGTFVIHGSTSAEDYPLLNSLQNAEYALRGILNGENAHYYIYQPGDNEQQNALTEVCRIDNRLYLRSDLLDDHVYELPSADEILADLVHTEGENPSILSAILEMILQKKSEPDGSSAVTEKLEKQIEMWINGFAAETSFQTRDDAAPRLSLEFKIPLSALYQQIADMAAAIPQDESTLALLKQTLTEEELTVYANADLGSFYLQALQLLSMDGEIVFSRTVSTLGEPLSTCLRLPLDESRTGYSLLEIRNDEENSMITVAGEKGIYGLELPADFHAEEQEYQKQFRFFRANVKDRAGKPTENLALRITVTKTHSEYEEEEGPRTHEKDHYTLLAVRDDSVLPEGMTAEMVPETEEISAELELHYSSKLELSSPTTLEFSFRMEQKDRAFEITGQVKTASPWEFLPFGTEDAVKLSNLAEETLKPLRDLWTKNAEKGIERVPMEIRMPDEDTATEQP